MWSCGLQEMQVIFLSAYPDWASWFVCINQVKANCNLYLLILKTFKSNILLVTLNKKGIHHFHKLTGCNISFNALSRYVCIQAYTTGSYITPDIRSHLNNSWWFIEVFCYRDLVGAIFDFTLSPSLFFFFFFRRKLTLLSLYISCDFCSDIRVSEHCGTF